MTKEGTTRASDYKKCGVDRRHSKSGKLWEIRCRYGDFLCNQLDYPATCGPKGPGSSSAAA